jgi:hypothetical protein
MIRCCIYSETALSGRATLPIRWTSSPIIQERTFEHRTMRVPASPPQRLKLCQRRI